MEGFGPATYGDSFAEVYDEWYGRITDANATAAVVAAHAVAGPVLELGIGSGRLVSALQQVGLAVIGIDASAAMLERCRAAHPSTPVVQADLAHLPIGGGLGGALCAFNTLFNLTTAEAQANLFINIAHSLAPGAPLVIEAMTGEGLDQGPPSSVGVSKMTTTELVLSATVVDYSAQTIQGQHVDISDAGIVLRPWMLRWTTPAEMDAMATSAGFTLQARWAGWHNEPFEAASDSHVSVYVQRAPAATSTAS